MECSRKKNLAPEPTHIDYVMPTPQRITLSGVDRVNEMLPSQVWNLRCTFLTQARPVYKRRQLVSVLSPYFLQTESSSSCSRCQDETLVMKAGFRRLNWRLSSSACTILKQLNPLLNVQNFNRNRARITEEKVCWFSKEGGKGCQS